MIKKRMLTLFLDIQTFTKKSCLTLWFGATIVRLEAQVALRNLLHYISDVHLAIHAKQQHRTIYNIVIYDIENLSITFEKGKIP